MGKIARVLKGREEGGGREDDDGGEAVWRRAPNLKCHRADSTIRRMRGKLVLQGE